MTGAEYLALARALRPEMLVVLAAFAALFADLGWWRSLPTPARMRRNAALLTLGMLGAAVAVTLGPETAERLDGALSLTPVGQALKVVVLLLAVVAAWLAAEETFTDHVGEFLAVLALATVGVLFLLSTENLLLIFVALELVSLSLYVLTAFNARSARGAEAALKYFLFGGTAAAFLLFGFSLLYGLTGSIRLPAVAEALGRQAGDPLAWVAVVLVLAGLGFKVAAAPFHFWAPDAYEGAPTAVAGFIASASKVGAFFLAARLLQTGLAGLEGSGAWGGFAPGWTAGVALLAVASMAAGNLAALRQAGLRRLLAWSAVAQAGYGLVGLVGDPEHAAPAVLYFVVTYALAVAGLFGVVAVVQGPGGGDAITRLAGLRERSPGLAWAVTVFVLSLAGIPPLSGFFGKFYLFLAAARAGQGLGYLWLVLVALGFSCVSLYYYLQVLKQVWVVDAPPAARLRLSPAATAVLLLLAALVVLTGLAPELLLGHLRP